MLSANTVYLLNSWIIKSSVEIKRIHFFFTFFVAEKEIIWTYLRFCFVLFCHRKCNLFCVSNFLLFWYFLYEKKWFIYFIFINLFIVNLHCYRQQHLFLLFFLRFCHSFETIRFCYYFLFYDFFSIQLKTFCLFVGRSQFRQIQKWFLVFRSLWLRGQMIRYTKKIDSWNFCFCFFFFAQLKIFFCSMQFHCLLSLRKKLP